MAKHNDVQQTEHVRHVVHRNGNEGFRPGGEVSANWPPKESASSKGDGYAGSGTPIHSAAKPIVNGTPQRMMHGAPMSQQPATGREGTLGIKAPGAHSASMDSPVREQGRRMPLPDIVSKAAEVASADVMDHFPPNGVLGRG